MTLRFRSVIIAVILPLTASASSAQSAGGPRLDRTRAGVNTGVNTRVRAGVPAVTAIAVTALATRAPQPSITKQRGVPQMIIGGAALVGGAIVGNDVGTIIMLGGLGYGIYGLYLYLH